MLNKICLVLDDLLNILMKEELEDQRHVVTVQEKLREKLKFEYVCKQMGLVIVIPGNDRITHGIASATSGVTA